MPLMVLDFGRVINLTWLVLRPSTADDSGLRPRRRLRRASQRGLRPRCGAPESGFIGDDDSAAPYPNGYGLRMKL